MSNAAVRALNRAVIPVAFTWGSTLSSAASGYVWTASEKVMNEILFPDGILLQYSWAPFFARSILVPAIEWLVSRTIM